MKPIYLVNPNLTIKVYDPKIFELEWDPSLIESYIYIGYQDTWAIIKGNYELDILYLRFIKAPPENIKLLVQLME